MLVGFMGDEYLYNLDKELLNNLQIDVILIKNKQDLMNIDGLIISAFGKENLKISPKMCEDILMRANTNLVILANGFASFWLCKNNLGLLNAYAKNLRQNKMRTNVLSVNSWQKRFIVTFVPKICFRKIAPNIAVLAEIDDEAVMLRQGNILACSFLPELSKNNSIYQYFKQMLVDAKEV